MAIFTIETQNYFLKKVCLDYINLWKNYLKNLNNFLVWLSIILMIITIPFYIAYLLLYIIYLVFAFAQDSENFPSNKTCRILIIILKILLIIPSYAFIIIAYYPAFIIGGIITIITNPCKKVVTNIAIKKLLNEDNKGEKLS